MTRKTIYLQILITIILLAAALALFELTNIDLAIQDHLFVQQTQSWLIDTKDPLGRFLFYDGFKAALIVLGVTAAAAYLASFFYASLRDYRSRLLLLLLSMIFVPLIIAGMKDFTNIYCPSQLEHYGGDKPYVKVFESYPKDFVQTSRGRCFPAGHAAGGFSLMMLYFVFCQKRHRRLGLLFGIGSGWITGIYQMAKGAHFLSHTVVTMLGAWLIILIIYRFAGGKTDETAVFSV